MNNQTNHNLTEIITQRALLVGLDIGEEDFEISLSELRELTETAGGEVVGVMTQKRPTPEKATYIGSGRLEEIKEFCEANDVDIIIFDAELSPTQLRNIEDETAVHTIDRTMLILDIFAKRAKTSEGKMQVELAQMRYMLPRLTGKGIELSRLGGGIGTRGPGETKLETDRRHIRRRIDQLSEKMAEVEERRERTRAHRRKTGVVTAAIVGYTNAGKSTLLNYLTGAGVLAENKLFATLDPTARALNYNKNKNLPSGAEVLLVDTVGFIRQLPHHLIKAFRSTLGEAKEADMILLVLDSSDPSVRSQKEVTQNLLEELGAGDKPAVTILNKSDIADPADLFDIAGVRISAITGQGIDDLLAAIDEANPRKMTRLEITLPFDKVPLAAEIRVSGEVLEEEYTENGLKLTALCDPAVAGRVKKQLAIEN